MSAFGTHFLLYKIIAFYLIKKYLSIHNILLEIFIYLWYNNKDLILSTYIISERICT